MRHLPLPLLGLALCLACCTPSKELQQGEQSVLVSFRAAAAGTKAGAVLSPGGAVSTLDVLLFRSSGALESHVHCDGDEVVASLPKGVILSWRAVANAPDGTFDAVSTASQMDALLSHLQDNSPTALVMAGSGSGAFSDDAAVGVALSRVMCRVCLGRVSTDYFGSAAHIRRVFLLNVATACPYTLSPDVAGEYCNKMTLDETLPEYIRSCTLAQLDVPFRVGTPGDVDITLYCYPNPVSNSVNSASNPAWCERSTRLVLEVDSPGDGLMYYPVDMPAMQCNTSYVVNELIIKGPGAAAPDLPVVREAIEPGLVIRPWGEIAQEVDLQ